MSAIDFKALMIEERKRLRAAAAKEKAAPAVNDNFSTKDASPTTGGTELDVVYRLPVRVNRPLLSSEHRVECGAELVQHIPEWCTPEEERELLRCVDGAAPQRWTKLRGRRLQSLGGLPKPPPEMMSREELPIWVNSVCEALVACGVFPEDAPPNHVLLNEYQPGQGIDAHKDGPLYAPRVAILSLNSTACFEFLEETSTAEASDPANDSTGSIRRPVAKLLLPPRGVLVFSGDAYTDKLHRVPARAADDLQQPGLVCLDDGRVEGGGKLLPRGRRISLTVRRVLHSTAEGPDTPAPRSLNEEKMAVARLFGARDSPQVSPVIERRGVPATAASPKRLRHDLEAPPQDAMQAPSTASPESSSIGSNISFLDAVNRRSEDANRQMDVR